MFNILSIDGSSCQMPREPFATFFKSYPCKYFILADSTCVCIATAADFSIQVQMNQWKIYIHACIRACVRVYTIHTYIHIDNFYEHTYIHTYNGCVWTYIRAWMRACAPAGVRNIHTYVPHTYLPTYLSTYIHTYIRTYVCACVRACMRACVHTYIHNIHRFGWRFAVNMYICVGTCIHT